ncbi:hypothetical protein O181_038381 [Austropuccinia psidii MF-1]|uniref:Uncharacterized protein n=1 Tax=Austropuccinia psidii MF-1 TaxID=1389203 RepID=A0A9Q3DDV8_9BASI|nr:hypothetical protein [Austropuccinia psidii MF-1]
MLPHPHLILSTAYHAYAPTAPSRYDSSSATASSSSPQLTMRMLFLCPHDMPPTLPPHVRLHLALCFRPLPLRMLTLAQDP